tara:strand:- start:14 stop:286 length:273 start_codon:yes stop_codon:yes gene_type:complete
MFNKIKNTLFLIIFSIFTFLVTKHYFSDENVIFTNKSRSSYALQVNIDNKSLPILKNDTNNIIIYKNDVEEFTKKRKKRFWEKLISDKNE